jgi:hypothetical protein
MNCRHCNFGLQNIFLDLEYAPASNAYLNAKDLQGPEKYYPLKVGVCSKCWLVQTYDYTNATDLFDSEYAYFSSTSSSWLEHSKKYFQKIKKLLNLNKNSFIVELASNDGYLLKNFVEEGFKCLGVEPTASTAEAAEKIGINVFREFFGHKTSAEIVNSWGKASLIIGNNVYAHVPDINDFTKGMKNLLLSNGTITLEFPHLLNIIQKNQFDTIYHEHFSYLSLHSVNSIFNAHGLRLYDAEKIATHGGSLRVYGCHSDDVRTSSKSLLSLVKEELDFGLMEIHTYENFQFQAEQIKNNLLSFLINQKENKKTVVAYGAAAKGNTLLNYAGVKKDLLSCVYDAALSKQNKFMPGSHIPIKSPDILIAEKPDYVLILPWNIADEIKLSLKSLEKSGTKFLIAVPKLKFL